MLFLSGYGFACKIRSPGVVGGEGVGLHLKDLKIRCDGYLLDCRDLSLTNSCGQASPKIARIRYGVMLIDLTGVKRFAQQIINEHAKQ